MNIALILSGGTGARLGASLPKQYIDVNGQMIITYCLKMFASHHDIDGIWIVCSGEWKAKILLDYSKQDLPKDKILGFSEPGENRQLSILNGLEGIKSYIDANSFSSNPVVIIHDAARPNLTSEYVSKCLDAIKGHDGVMPALPMKDTVYMSEDGKVISSLLNRSKIFAGQAPELYYLDRYLDANNALLPDAILSINGSTEPAIMADLDVAMIPGDENNYKITTMADLEKFSLEQQTRSQTDIS